MKRAQSAAYWIAPSLFCLILYWYGLRAWFRADDFAWLGLGREISNPSDFWRVMFTPMAQGTIRTLSERAFFIGFFALFGLDALPYRIFVFLTQFANLVLLSWIAIKLTGSRIAGFWAPVLWIANSAMVIAMTWCSAYNEILCAFFLLSAFALFLKAEETGKRRYYWWQLVAFVLGFGALEINVVYPALVASYLILNRRPIKPVLPLLAGSLAFTILHFTVAPRQTTGPYALSFDSAIFRTLLTYAKWALVPETWWLYEGAWGRRTVAIACVLASLLIGFVAIEVFRKHWNAALGVCWFVLLLSPVLPLKNHVAAYYLTLPAIGLAILGATAFAEAWRHGVVLRAVGMVAMAAYLSIAAPASRYQTRWFYELAHSAQILVLGVARAHELYPRATILLDGVDDDLYNNAVAHGPFRLFGATVYLAPQALTQITAHPQSANLSGFVLPAGLTLKGLAEEKIVVYTPAGDHLKNITSDYEQRARSDLKADVPRRVDVANPLFASLLGPTWYPVESGFRWMPRRATVRVAAPRAPAEKLYLQGACPEQLTLSGPLRFSVTIDGRKIGVADIQRGEGRFERSFDLPAASIGKDSMDVAIKLTRTLQRPEDGRELGLTFGIFEVR